MKTHLGVDRRTKLIHTVTATAANVANSTVLPQLLHGHGCGCKASSLPRTNRCDPLVRAPGPRRYATALSDARSGDWREQETNRLKSRVRAKNAHQLVVTCAWTNLFLVRRHVLAAAV